MLSFLRFYTFIILVGGFLCFSCNNQPNRLSNNTFTAQIKEYSDKDYPNNPDKSIRHSLEGTFSHAQIRFIQEDSIGTFSFELIPKNEKSSHIFVKNINLLEWIPAIPEHIKTDPYLEYIGVINQEWNRVQVSFDKSKIEIAGKSLEGDTLIRIDLARNCLNAYLWEVIAFAKENGEEKPIYHGWFDFPKELYAELFNKRNNVDYEKYRKPLENWITPESKPINYEVLRTVIPNSEKKVVFQNLNAEMYPIAGERKKKFINIGSPQNPKSMQDFLNDDTQFATFAIPGLYKKDEPRHTQLSKLSNLENIKIRKAIAKNNSQDTCLELALRFVRKSDNMVTNLVFGGLNARKFNKLSVSDANKGSAFSMGIANHTFNQTYKTLMETPSVTNPYFGFLTDAKNNWLDSHQIGIDGPLFHLDEKDATKLHLWLLSFERHALVGHYVIQL